MFDHSSARVTGAQCSLASYMSARFLTDSHTMPGQRHSQLTYTKLTLSLEKKNSPTSPAGIQACNLLITNLALYQKAIPASFQHITDRVKGGKSYEASHFLWPF